ncbi:hypothetical protein [Sulfobacillus harzensis]|uniref:Uncharacterized protein n=1 Tax=Sulfobacillus harzensis TaxID=2729629 RepID=A0A7Y0L4X7_9FIRM|nr:hypothetical protein [Sulfobacillus harzensis]NMP22485.1 hypothetical protein [Sulfobacillus harzensis]
MKRYVSGMVTGSLMGAVVAGFWLLRRNRRPMWRQARRLAPSAYRVARYGGSRLVHLAKRRLS